MTPHHTHGSTRSVVPSTMARRIRHSRPCTSSVNAVEMAADCTALSVSRMPRASVSVSVMGSMVPMPDAPR